MKFIKNLKNKFFRWVWREICLANRDTWAKPVTKADMELTPMIRKIVRENCKGKIYEVKPSNNVVRVR